MRYTSIVRSDAGFVLTNNCRRSPAATLVAEAYPSIHGHRNRVVASIRGRARSQSRLPGCAFSCATASGRAGSAIDHSFGGSVRPVKGEILRLRARPGVTPAPSRTIRGSVHGRPAYLVPRGDGLVVGATQYEADDTQVTVAGVRDLIADAEALLPAIGEYELYEATAGLRPMSPDNLPLIGRLSERVVAATWHGRNGVLFTPITADAVLAELADDPLAEAKNADPQRFPKEGL